MQKIFLIAININKSFDFKQYLRWFNPEIITHIRSFKFEKDQKIAFASAILKYYYLAYLLNTSPLEIKILFDEYKRPFLEGIYKTLDFNISHSGDYVVLGITRIGRIGVDIEKIDEKINIKQISPLVFSASERISINNTVRNFFMLWTKKEALLKSIGTGFLTEEFINTDLSLKEYEVNCNLLVQIGAKMIFDEYYLSVCIKGIDNIN